MTVVCKAIDNDILFSCNDPLSEGVKDEYYIFNHADIVSYTVDPTNPLVVTGLVLATGASGFKWQGFNGSNEPSFELVKKTFSPPKYKHIVKPKIFSNDPATKYQLYKLDNSRVVVVHQNNTKGTNGNQAFEVYGLDSGLIVDVHTRDLANADLAGGHEVEIASQDNALEPYPVKTFWDTTFAASLAKILSYL